MILRYANLAAIALAVAASSAEGAGSSAASAALITPDRTALASPAPDSFTVILTTSEGEVELRVRRAWAPVG